MQLLLCFTKDWIWLYVRSIWCCACFRLHCCAFDSKASLVAGSAVAFGKLHGVLASKPLALPGKNPLNIGLLAGNAAAGAAFLMTGDPVTGVAALGATTALGGVMGAHMTASIGG